MSTTIDLKSRYAELKASQPHTYLRNAAAELGVSEVELLCLQLGEGVTRLTDDPKVILKDVPQLGRVMALTRNNDVVHERKGSYKNPTLEGHVGLFVGADIDLRIFWSHWASAFAVEEQAAAAQTQGECSTQDLSLGRKQRYCIPSSGSTA